MASLAISNLASTVLREYGEITREALAQYLPKREPRRYLYDLIADYPLRGGKMMRPSLCIATARAFGADLGDALRTAVAIELLHNALLIHDDIEDGSEQRRGRPTLHTLHGVPLALNAGDTLTLMSLRPLIENDRRLGAHVSMRILEETERMLMECAEGQALELGWRYHNISSLGDANYLEMVLKKTCWLATIFPVRLGALIATRDAVDLDRFVAFGFFLGAAFQIQDDLLNLLPDERYGKERDGDLFEGKRTLMLIRLFELASRDERVRLLSILRGDRSERCAEHISWIRALMNRYGCIEYAQQFARWFAGAALHEYSIAYAGLPESRDKQFIKAMVTWVLERD